MLTARTPQEFSVELLMAEPKGRDSLWALTKEALDKWWNDPEALAEVAAVLNSAVIRVTEQGNLDLQREYLNMLGEVMQMVKEHFRPDFQDYFGLRFIEYCDELENDFTE